MQAHRRHDISDRSEECLFTSQKVAWNCDPYAKTSDSFLAAVQIRCMSLWAAII